MKGREVVATETRKQKQKLSGARGEENRLRAEGRGQGGDLVRAGTKAWNTPPPNPPSRQEWEGHLAAPKPGREVPGTRVR